KLIRTSKLKTSRTDENIDELETAPFKPNTGHEANGGGNEKAETAAEEVEVAETDIEIEDVLGDDDANLDNAVEDSDEVEGENVTAGDDGDEVPDKVDSPAAADDEEDDDGEFMDMNFEP
ncbi:MAG: hypothetical protein HQ517_14375, partial [SAR324 cluster bacterium]|nr:hypothetical protein [SAR324 cluster bacterium]